MARRRTGRVNHSVDNKLRKWFKAHCASINAPCVFCGKPIDYSLRYPHPQSFSLEHHVPLVLGGSQRDPANFRASHLVENVSSGAKLGNKLRGQRRHPNRTSRKW